MTEISPEFTVTDYALIELIKRIPVYDIEETRREVLYWVKRGGVGSGSVKLGDGIVAVVVDNEVIAIDFPGRMYITHALSITNPSNPTTKQGT